MTRRPPSWVRRGAFVLWAALIFAVSSVESAGSPESELTLRGITGHVAEYAVLGGLLVWAGAAPRAAVAFAAAYGVTDEVHQAFVPGRDASPVDWGLDVVGAVVGVAIALRRVLLGRHRRRCAASYNCRR
jgi:VanZ family protein